MKSNLKIIMLGASGAVGGFAAHALCGSPDIKQLTLLNRRVLEQLANNAKVVQPTVDVLSPQSYAHFLSGHDTAVCCLGVGEPSKTSKEEFIKIDKTAVLDFATACKAAGITHFQLLSAVGANAKSSSFYLKTKGELQDAIIALGFERTSFFQPSMILTPTNRYGFMQGLMLAVWPTLSLAFVGTLSKFRGVKVETLGRAMAKNVLITGQGVEILQWEDINRL